MEVNLRKRILAVGESTGRYRKNKTLVKKVRCQRCGKYIQSDGCLDNVEYVKTRRGSELFFHTDCLYRVWKHGIC